MTTSKRGGARANAGRKAGGTNTNSPDIKELCRKYAGECVESLINIARKSKHEGNRVAAINQILDRGFGKPSQSVVGNPEQPIELVVSWKRTPEGLGKK